jgi:hypothetical protein
MGTPLPCLQKERQTKIDRIGSNRIGSDRIETNRIRPKWHGNQSKNNRRKLRSEEEAVVLIWGSGTFGSWTCISRSDERTILQQLLLLLLLLPQSARGTQRSSNGLIYMCMHVYVHCTNGMYVRRCVCIQMVCVVHVMHAGIGTRHSSH